MIGDKWTLLVVRDLALGPKRTMELHAGLFPISSRTLVQRLRDMENDKFVTRTDYGGNPPHIEYELTERGRLLLPLADAFRQLGQTLGCSDCEDRRARLGDYCSACPRNPGYSKDSSEVVRPVPASRRKRDDSIILL
jgi:DNA-binding HxlR family transcriptional regulator